MMKNRNLLDSFNNAVNGIMYTVRHERNIKIHIAAAAVVLVLSLVYRLTKTEFLILCLTIGFVLVCELFNTAVEIIVDIIVDVYHPKAKVIKDIAAGAVLLSAFVSVIVGYFIFFERMSLMLKNGILMVKETPINITVIALLITMLTVLAMKAGSKKGTPFHGGMPSGHAALAFCIATAIALWTEQIEITILAGILALLVIQSRLEGKIHSKMELLAGAVTGFLITLLMFQLFGAG